MHAYIRRALGSSIGITSLLVASTILAPTTPTGRLSAQTGPDRSNTRGAFFSFRSGAAGVGFKNDRDGTGLGLGLRLGYGFSERFTGYIGFEGATISDGDGFEGVPVGEDYTMVFIDIGGRFHFGLDARWVPFAEASATVTGLGFHDADGREVGYGGPSGSIGVGLLYFAKPTLAIEAGGSFTAGNLSDREIDGVKSDVDLGVAAVRMHLGVSWYPFR